MVLDTRLRNTGQQGGGGGGGSGAPTDSPYITYTSDSTLSAERILKSGTNITVTTDATFFYINAVTGVAGAAGSTSTIQYNSGGVLAGDSGLTYNAANASAFLRGHLALGSIASVSTFNVLDLKDAFVDTSNDINAINLLINVAPASNANGFDVIGVNSVIQDSNATATIQDFYGGYFHPLHISNNSQSVLIGIFADAKSMSSSQTSTIRGAQFRGNNAGLGNANSIDGFYSEAAINSGNAINLFAGRFVTTIWNSTATNVYGSYITTPAAILASNVSNSYGVFIEDQTVATNDNYNVYSAGNSSTNFFAGLVGVGTSKPAVNLHVLGSSRTSNLSVTVLGTGLVLASSGGTNYVSTLALGSALTFVSLNSNAYTYEHKVFTAGSSVVITYQNTGITISALTGGASSNSGGLAGTGMFYLMSTAQTAFPNSRQVLAGSSITVRTDATNFYIDAITPGVSANSGGLAGTGMFYLMSTAQTSFPNSRQVLAGSSITVRTDATNFYIDAITPGVSANSGGLAGTGMFYLMSTAQTSFPNSRQVLAGSSVTVVTDGTNLYINALTGGGVAAAATRDWNYYRQVGTGQNVLAATAIRMYVAGIISGAASTTVNVGLNSINCVPFLVVKSLLVDTMACNITTAAGGTAQIQMGIYSNSADTILWPYQAIVTSGYLTGTNTGLIPFGINETLSSNTLYWFTYLAATGTPTVRGIAAGGQFPIFGMDITLNVHGTFVQIALTTSTLPATMPGSGSVISSATAFPSLAIRGSI